MQFPEVKCNFLRKMQLCKKVWFIRSYCSIYVLDQNHWYCAESYSGESGRVCWYFIYIAKISNDLTQLHNFKSFLHYGTLYSPIFKILNAKIRKQTVFIEWTAPRPFHFSLNHIWSSKHHSGSKIFQKVSKLA